MNAFEQSKQRIHYGWIVAFVAMICVTAALGFCRFTLGVLLPSMSADLKLAYYQRGFISSANLLGYLVSALLIARLSVKTGPRIFIFCALVAAGTFMTLATWANSFTSLFLLNVVIGLCSAAASVPSMGLASAWFSKRLRGRAAGLIVVGSGIAIMISGVLIPYVNRIAGIQGWRLSWRILGAATVIVACVAFAVLRNRPQELNLTPAGGGEDPLPAPTDSPGAGKTSIYLNKIIYHLGAIYFFFGLSYMVYSMFIVTVMVEERGFPENTAGVLWMWLGFLSLFSGPVFGALSDRLGRKTGFILVFSLQAVAYLLIAMRLPGAFLYLSILFFGITAWSIPGIMAASMGDYVGAGRAAEALGLVTFMLGIGQMSGPAIAGMVAQRVGNFSASFFLAATFTCLAIVLSAFLKAPEETPAARSQDAPRKS
ncbi:MAG: MFS transporter [Syntrophorhabdaceae bacterium]|nr:MFS transporter [Syntrophorhabdaceae bacterium]